MIRFQKCLFGLLIIFPMSLPTGLIAVAVSASKLASIHAADKKTRTSVTGTGKSKTEAENDAARTARQISTNYTTVSKKTSGADKNYVCTMVIEYAQK